MASHRPALCSVFMTRSELVDEDVSGPAGAKTVAWHLRCRRRQLLLFVLQLPGNDMSAPLSFNTEGNRKLQEVSRKLPEKGRNFLRWCDERPEGDELWTSVFGGVSSERRRAGRPPRHDTTSRKHRTLPAELRTAHAVNSNDCWQVSGCSATFGSQRGLRIFTHHPQMIRCGWGPHASASPGLICDVEMSPTNERWSFIKSGCT